MRNRAAALAALSLTALFAAGCGDDEAEPSGSAPQGRPDRVVIEAQKGAFDARTVFEAVAPGVVTIRSVFGEGPLGPEGGQGSGFVLDEDGRIATNAHVVTDADAVGGEDTEIEVADEVYVEFPDRNQVAAEVIGWDPHSDVALIEVDPDGLALDPVALGSDAELEVGDTVAAIGSPFGAEQSLSVGIVSALNRTIPSLSRFQIDGAIQTDASVNPGNSGGPLIDAGGRVVGINQQITSTSGGDEGVGYAVPIDLAERVLEQLGEDGKASYAYIGVTTQSLYPQLAERLDIEVDQGALVAEVVEGGPAADAGLRAGGEEISFQAIPDIQIGGDVIIAVDGEPINAEGDLAELIAVHEPGEEVELEILRDGERRKVTVKLGDREEIAGTEPE